MSCGELAKALASARAVMKSGTVYKGGTNQHQKYPYVGHEHVMTSGAREALQEHGLALVQTSVDYVGEIPAGKNPALLWRGNFKLMHTSGESLDLVFSATTQPNDKAAFVASTGLDRTAFLRVLALAGSTEDDPDHDVHDKRAQEHQQSRSAGDAATRAAESATTSERERASIAASFNQLIQKMRDANHNTRAKVDPLLEEASKLKPKLLERQLEELAVEARNAIARVRETEQAEIALRAQEAAKRGEQPPEASP